MQGTDSIIYNEFIAFIFIWNHSDCLKHFNNTIIRSSSYVPLVFRTILNLELLCWKYAWKIKNNLKTFRKKTLLWYEVWIRSYKL